MSKSKPKEDSSEPYFYIALVLKGTEDQYLDLLKYVNKNNGAKVLYQCKSLTYLRVERDDGVRIKAATPELLAKASRRSEATEQ